MPTSSYQDLIVWQKAVLLAKQVYSLTRRLPHTEQYGLASQMQRAAVSIASNIAEGSRRGTRRDFLHFVRIAHGSTAELETQIYIFMTVYPHIEVNQPLIDLSNEVSRLLTGLRQHLSSQ